LHVLLCAGEDVGAGFVGVGVGGGVGMGTCCMMVTGAGVGLETDATHSSRPVTAMMPERI
jgi:hypothetical protein